MKKLTLIVSLALASLLSACGQHESAPPPVPVSPVTNTAPFELKVTSWGPQTSAPGAIENKQPTGGMGMWIDVSSTQGLGDAEVLFDGKPGKHINVDSKLITVEIPPDQLAVAGKYAVAVKQVSTGKLYPVGEFEVKAAK